MRRSLSRFVRAWAPPNVRDWLVKQVAGVRRVACWPVSTDNGWTDAVSAAVAGYGDGMRRISESSIIGLAPGENAREFSDGSKQLHDRLIQFAFVAARAAQGDDQLRVLDYGGGFGAHAVALSRLVPELAVQYTVAELPIFCRAAREINPTVRFVEGLAVAGSGYHLVYASSSIQYTENWRELLGSLCGASTRFLFVTRTPFVLEGPPFVTIQRAYQTEYPGWVFNFNELVAEVGRHDFELNEVFLNGPGLPIRGARKANVHLGLLFERAEEARK